MNQEHAKMDNKREEVRMRRLKEARLIFNNKASVMSCVVRDASNCGARVTIGEPYLVPYEFDFAMTGAAARPARKIWVKQNEMGLQYID